MDRVSFRPGGPNSPPPLPASPEWLPIAESRRDSVIDALRGLAILGIFLVNVLGFKAPLLAARSGNGISDQVGLMAIEILAAGKFITIFALLFGLGMTLQERRALAAGKPFARFFVRRMIVLLLFGVIHALLLWAGDVLATYAVFGLLGLCFIGCRPRTLLLWAAGLFVTALVSMSGLGAIAGLAGGGDATWERDVFDFFENAYLHGSLGEIVSARAIEWGLMWLVGVFSVFPYVFAVFLTGMALGKLGVIDKLDRWLPKLVYALWLTLPVGLMGGVAYYLNRPEAEVGLLRTAFGAAVYWATIPLLSVSYIIMVLDLFRSGRATKLMASLVAVGRLSLTNYLAQSLVANILFMGWGFGLYGKMNVFTGIIIVGAVFAAQSYLSVWWLRHFRTGPVEWLWRVLTYGKLPPLRRERDSALRAAAGGSC
jgi:uncharacterized protein